MFYLLCVKKLAPHHIKSTHGADALDSKLCYSNFLPAVMVLGSRQSSLYNQDLNFQFNFESKLGEPISEKKIIYLLILKELHLEHILALCHANISSGSIKLVPLPPPPPPPLDETFRYYIRAYKCCLKNVKFQLSWK